MPSLYLALMHYPVINRNGEIITSAVTNLDLHDISRAAKTYGVRKFFVVTPLSDQKELVKKIVAHWTTGIGSRHNPDRREALNLISVKDSLDEVLAVVTDNGEGIPKTVVTCARPSARNISFGDLKDKIGDGKPYLLLFGTAWGLSDDFINSADYILEPVKGINGYNHLSVRSAAAIILSRLVKVV
jgi:hypothetical protein